MGVEDESLARLWRGNLSLKDFEWQETLRPSVPFDRFHEAGLIPEIDLQPLLHPCPDDDTDTVIIPDHQKTLEKDQKTQSDDKQVRPYDHHHKIYQDKQLVKELICAASHRCGFFQVYHHGIPLTALRTLLDYSRRFFGLPPEDKIKIAHSIGSLAADFKFKSGYMCGSNAECINRWWCEALRVATSSPDAVREVALCLWEKEEDQQKFSDALMECSNGFTKLAETLTKVLLEGLGIKGEEVLEEFVKDGEDKDGLKLNFYPACPQPDVTLGLPAHSDICILTILFQDDVAGLQVNQDGLWATIRPRHDALVVNVGDILQVWSNDKYVSGLHRAVLNSSSSRYSIAYFFNPSLESILSPLPNLLKIEAPKFRSTRVSEHRQHAFGLVFKGEGGGVDYLRFG